MIILFSEFCQGYEAKRSMDHGLAAMLQFANLVTVCDVGVLTHQP